MSLSFSIPAGNRVEVEAWALTSIPIRVLSNPTGQTRPSPGQFPLKPPLPAVNGQPIRVQGIKFGAGIFPYSSAKDWTLSLQTKSGTDWIDNNINFASSPLPTAGIEKSRIRYQNELVVLFVTTRPRYTSGAGWGGLLMPSIEYTKHDEGPPTDPENVFALVIAKREGRRRELQVPLYDAYWPIKPGLNQFNTPIELFTGSLIWETPMKIQVRFIESHGTLGGLGPGDRILGTFGVELYNRTGQSGGTYVDHTVTPVDHCTYEQRGAILVSCLK